MTATCALCGEPVDPHSRMVLRRVTGFAESRGAVGGVHGLRDREWLDEFAHTICLDRKKLGHTFGQQSLDGLAA